MSHVAYPNPNAGKVKPPVVGVICVDYPDLPYKLGDVHFPGSYAPGVKIAMEKVPGLTFDHCMDGTWNEELKEASRISLKKLEDAGATCVIGDAGYFFRYASEFSKLTKLPVLGSAVNMLPVIE